METETKTNSRRTHVRATGVGEKGRGQLEKMHHVHFNSNNAQWVNEHTFTNTKAINTGNEQRGTLQDEHQANLSVISATAALTNFT